MKFFQASVLKKHLKALNSNDVKEAYKKFSDYFLNAEMQENIRELKEEQFQEGFLRELFVNVLGYTLNPTPRYNLTTEFKNEVGAKKADGAILRDGRALGVIELKGTDTTDLNSISKQAFDYKNNHTGCIYVVTSNFEKLRFFIHDSVEHLEFDLFTLSEEEFAVLWLCLSPTNIFAGVPLNVKEESKVKEKNITKQLYKDYSTFRMEMWENMQLHNPHIDQLELFNKTQKLLDRFLFILFGEDSGLLPPNSITTILSRWTLLKKEDAYKPLYEIFKQFFGYINLGRKSDNEVDTIYEYNGGLFQPDSVLDNLVLDDEIILKHASNLTKYDFQSEVDVNILGHIFENSLTEIELIKAEIEGKSIDKSETKKKKDGVYYTPKFVTKYIVESTVGDLCRKKKQALGIKDEEYSRGRKYRKKETVKMLDEQLNLYRDWLLKITICDPACGSGAFLNQALEFLIDEHCYIDLLQAQLLGKSIVYPDVEKHILENNIFGVDINEESVEIAKLSLWLRTAQRGRKLTTLTNNLKCGNSLISSEEIAGKKAFDWGQEFPIVNETGGFDVVIGNPPYGIFIDEDLQEYYENEFPLTQYKINLYILFIERMLQIFNRGVVHFIIPKSLLFNSYYEGIRRALISRTEINEIYTITEKVFEDAEVGGSLLIQFVIKDNIDTKNIIKLASADKIENFITTVGMVRNQKPQDYFLSIPNCEISIVPEDSNYILNQLHSLKKIGDFYKLKNGLNPGNVKHILISDKKLSDNHKPIIWGKDIDKYSIEWSGEFINYDSEIGSSITIDDIKSKEGMNKQNKVDFALRSSDLFEARKIVIRKTGDSLIAALDENNYYFDTLVHGIYENDSKYPLEFLLAILNSKAATKFYRLLHDIKGKAFAKISLDNLESFPFPECNKQEIDSLCNLSKLIINKTTHLNEISSQFLNLLMSKYDIEKLSGKLVEWYKHDFKTFLSELGKCKIKLGLSVEAEWMSYFGEQKGKADLLVNEIANIENQIEEMILQIYDLE